MPNPFRISLVAAALLPSAYVMSTPEAPPPQIPVALQPAPQLQWVTPSPHLSPVAAFAPASSTVSSPWKDSADSLDAVSPQVNGYDPLISDGSQLEGSGAWFLTHAGGLSTEILLLDPAFSVQTGDRFFFESKLGIATDDQIARVEISTDDGQSWGDGPAWSLAGIGQPGQATFSRISIDLNAYAGQSIRVRFVYQFAGGTYFAGTANQFGWKIDDVQFGPEYQLDPVVYNMGDPSDAEQQSLEFINRARESASAEATRLKDSPDPDVQSAIHFFNVDTALMITQFGALEESLPPLVFHPQLIVMARLHSMDMFVNEFQAHTSSQNPVSPILPGSSVGVRATTVGYPYNSIRENVYSYADSVWHAHAGFNIDWGYGTGGMQVPPGHREAIHDPGVREIGIGIVEGRNGEVGPYVVTQNFGSNSDYDGPFVTGVAFNDTNENDFYDPGEGLAGIEVTIPGLRHKAITSTSGGYAIPVNSDGTYTVNFEGDGVPSWSAEVTITGNKNRKLDYPLDEIPGTGRTWGLDWPVSEADDVNTGENLLGWLNVREGPFVYSYSLERYIFLPEEIVSPVGTWLFVFALSEFPSADPSAWAGFWQPDSAGDANTHDFIGWVNVREAPFIWLWSMSRYIYLPEEIVTPNGSWMFFPNQNP